MGEGVVAVGVLSALAHTGLRRFLLARHSEVVRLTWGGWRRGGYLAPRLPFAAPTDLAEQPVDM